MLGGLGIPDDAVMLNHKEMKMYKAQNEKSLSNFNPDEAFFFIDSDNLQDTKTALYGYCFAGDMITDKLEVLADSDFNNAGGGIFMLKEMAQRLQ